MVLPIPKHLRNILVPVGEFNDEFCVTGKVVCECGAKDFSIGLVGDSHEYDKIKVIKTKELGNNYFLILRVSCNICGRDYLIFDADHHGWNAFVAGGDSKNSPRPSVEVWHCNKCNKTNHSLMVKINSQGKADFMELGEDFNENDWVEAFDWITVGVQCNACNEKNIEWISYETM
jgi:hypothetical protein